MTPHAFQIERSAFSRTPEQGSAAMGNASMGNAATGGATQFRQAAAHLLHSSAAGSTRRMTPPQPDRLVDKVTRASQASPAADETPCPGSDRGMGAVSRSSPPVLKTAVRLLTARRVVR